MSAERMPIPVKKCPKSNDKFVTYVLLLVANFTASTTFTSPTPTMAVLGAKAKALADANAKARGKAPGAAADRDAQRLDVEEQIDHLVDYVKGAIKTLGVDAATAIALILTTGLSVRKTGRSPKAPLTATPAGLPGEVLLVALALAPNAVYWWEYSSDSKVWTSVPETMTARTTIAGLTPGQVYYFRFHGRTRKGAVDYSDAVKCMVL